MATFALIHGGGSTAWDWHLVSPLLESAGQEVVAVDLPIENANAELAEDWWANTGHIHESVDEDPAVSFFNGVPDDLADEARRRERDQDGAWLSRPWPAGHHPEVPTRAILCTDDQFFPATFMRRQVRERLGIAPIEIPGGHYATLTEPAAVAMALTEFASELS